MPGYNDPADRLREATDKIEVRLRRRFQEIVANIQSSIVIGELVRLIERGATREAMAIVERAAKQYAADATGAFIQAGKETATFMRDRLHISVDFDQVNERAVAAMQRNRLNLIRGFTEEQRRVTQEALFQGVREGLNPRDMARLFRDSIGLTPYQLKAVENYKKLLQEGDVSALSRKLRDGRYDSTVRRFIEDQKRIPKAKIDEMVGRYRDRFIQYRSEVIARTEALRAVHEGSAEMYNQAFDSGELEPKDIVREWNTAHDTRVRNSHSFMHGQKRGANEPFLSGDGNLLMYPGDISAPASDTIQCRCAVGTRIRLSSTESVSMNVA